MTESGVVLESWMVAAAEPDSDSTRAIRQDGVKYTELALGTPGITHSPVGLSLIIEFIPRVI
jgi:hypothetical protein